MCFIRLCVVALPYGMVLPVTCAEVDGTRRGLKRPLPVPKGVKQAFRAGGQSAARTGGKWYENGKKAPSSRKPRMNAMRHEPFPVAIRFYGLTECLGVGSPGLRFVPAC